MICTDHSKYTVYTLQTQNVFFTLKKNHYTLYTRSCIYKGQKFQFYFVFNMSIVSPITFYTDMYLLSQKIGIVTMILHACCD